MHTRRILAVGLLVATAAILIRQLDYSPFTRSPSSTKRSMLINAEKDGYIEVLFRSEKKNVTLRRKKESIGRVDLNKLMQETPIYSSLLSKAADINSPTTIALLNEANNRFILALGDVAKEDNLLAIVRDGRRLEDSEFAIKFQKFQDVTSQLIKKMNQ